MYAGIVAGSVVATVKDPGIENIPLLIVQKIENGREAGLVVAADQTRQAGIGDHVYMIGSKEAARIFRKKLTPVDVAIVGFIDEYNEEL
ncbi:MAG: ethanolamine utilization protein EutN [Parasporobacterium sp.]|nr:ethanolamine utilization protein EutN [Parasporobacterium sp.]